MPRFIAFVLVLVLAAGFASTAAASGPSAPAITTVARSLSRFSDSGGFEQRLLIDSGTTRGFLALGLGAGEDYLVAGLRTPELTVGPVAPGGLVREIYRPTRFSSGSTVYNEATGLLLLTVLEPARRVGVQVQPWTLSPAVFGVVQDDVVELLGAHWRGRIGIADVALAALTAEPEAERPDEGWYTEYPRFPGGRVNHLASELAFTARSVRVAVAGFAAAGTLVAPSSAVRLRLEHRSALLRASAVSAAVAPGYISPEGSFSRDANHNAARLRVGRTRGVYLDLDGARRIGRAPLRDGRVAPLRLHVGAGTGVSEYAVGPRARLSAGTSGAWSESTDDRGRTTERVVADGLLAIRSGGGRARLSVSRGWEDGELDRDRVELTGGLRGSVLSLDGRLFALFLDGRTSVGGRIEARARFDQVDLFGRISTVDQIDLDDLSVEKAVPFGFMVGAVVTRRTVSSRGLVSGGASTGSAPTLQPEAPRAPD